MKYKQDIQKLLFDLKTANIERPQIEKDLHYSEDYIDQVLAKGGNKKFYENLKSYAKRMLQKTTKGESPIEDKLSETALRFLRMLEIQTDTVNSQHYIIKRYIEEAPDINEAPKNASPPLKAVKPGK